jgi:GNAT superfamily N-acetyltransferase
MITKEEKKKMKYIDTKLEGFQLRFAEDKDTALILGFIRELAAYEKMSDDVIATEEVLRESLFERRAAEVVIGEYEGNPAGFALFFHNFSTFLGRPGIYLEDLYVRPEMRGKGLGKIMLSFLARLTVERKCGRLEWACLDWNEPSIRFYKNLGAVPMDEWTVYRVSDRALEELSLTFIR